MNGRLRQLRESKALARQDLARASGVNEITIYRAERGKTKLRPSTIRKLAKALEVDPSEITRGSSNL